MLPASPWSRERPERDRARRCCDVADRMQSGVLSLEADARNQRHIYWEPWDSCYGRSQGSLEVSHGNKAAL